MTRKTLPNISEIEFKEIPFKELMSKRIYNVLIICSNYDFYLLEEDGRIDEKIFNEYTRLNLRYPPTFFHANCEKKALEILDSVYIDLIITWMDTSEKSIEISSKIKNKYPKTPIAAIGYYSSELKKILNQSKSNDIDFVFHWSGNSEIFLAIIKLVEDRMNSERDINEIGSQAILLVEDSLQFYSKYIPMIYKIILKQTGYYVQEGLNEHNRMMFRRGRPKILFATTYEEGVELFEKFKNNILGVVSDVTYYVEGEKDQLAGFKFLEYVRNQIDDFPFIIQSAELKNKEIAEEKDALFLYKHSNTLRLDMEDYLVKSVLFGKFVFRDPENNAPIVSIKNLKQLQDRLKNIPVSSLVYHAKKNHFSKWLKARALFGLANLFSEFTYEDFLDGDEVRDFLIKAIKQYRIFRSSGVIAQFDRNTYDEYLIFSRIGKGSLGGKGRGLAFIDNFLKRRKNELIYDNIKISIPRTVVISTDVFDQFVEKHDLIRFAVDAKSDEEVLKKFTSCDLPKWAAKDIKHFVSTLNTPIAVRSSSVLEDSLEQPFAGVYSTYMVPNADLKTTYKYVLNAIKSVMASAFYKGSKAYINSTSFSFEESQMAVILQEVVGNRYDDVFFPNISGVARSLNFYPIGQEKAEEGIANIALGLGEIIVEGGKTLRFSPHHPDKILQLTNTATSLQETQKHLFALEMDPESFKISTSQTVNKRQISIRSIKNHRALKFVASTYDHTNHILRTGVREDGIRVLTFDQILKYNSFPLADILKKLLDIGKQEMQSPIEIEFAVNLDVPENEPKFFSFLQIRPTINTLGFDSKIPKEINLDNTVIYSESALGIGAFDGLKDVVYVKPDVFDKSKTKEIAKLIEKINNSFENSKRKYILIGPGRWGSSDPWLGIPVSWSQISYAKIIIESGLEDYRIEPSQGTHFFQNLTAFKVGYITINPAIGDGHFDVDYLDKQEAVYEDDFVRHVRFEESLKVFIDGKENKAVICKSGLVPIQSQH